MPKPDGSLTAVVVSGGKQYRVAPGDHVLVDRLAAEAGSSIKLGRVLLLHDGDEITLGAPGVEGLEIEAKVLSHPRGPRIEVLRYKSKKRQRVHRGARADLTALEILPFGSAAKPAVEEKAAEKEEKPKRRRSTPKAKVEEPKAEAPEAVESEEKESE